MTEYFNNRADTSGWEEQLYPDADEEDDGVDEVTTE